MFLPLLLLRSMRGEVTASTPPKIQTESPPQKEETPLTRRIRRQPKGMKRRMRGEMNEWTTKSKREKGHRNWEGRGRRGTVKPRGEHCLLMEES